MLNTFGPSPALYVEADPDPQNPNAVPQRLSGITVPIMNADTGEALPDAVTGPGGYLYYQVEDVPVIQFATKRWDGSQYVDAVIIAMSNEMQFQLRTQADTSAQAMSTANDALVKAQQALANAVAGGVASVNGVTPDANGSITLTAGSVGARSVAVKVPAAEVSGLAPTATSSDWSKLTGTIPSAILQTSDLGKPGKAASLGADGKLASSQVPDGLGGGGTGYQPVWQNPDGTWPDRPTNDDVVIDWVCLDWSKQPALVTTGLGGMHQKDRLLRVAVAA